MKVKYKLFVVLLGLTAGSVILTIFAVLGSGLSLKEGESPYPLAVLLFILLSVAASIAYAGAVWISGPIEAISEQAGQVAAWPSRHEMPVKGKDELAEIAKAINKMRMDLTEGEKARTSLIADAAHELRTPVSIFRGHLETILSGANELRAENLLPLLDETKRMTRLIEDLQQLSLAETGRLSLDYRWIDFGAMLEEIVAILEPEADEKGLQFACYGTAPCEVYCDPARMKQVVINLIGNAIRYTPSGGTVQTRFEIGSDMVKVEIADNGPGIAPEHLPYVFRRFYRVEGSRNRKSGGMGLGLAIAKEFTAAHGGQLEVSSSPGKGTVFTVTLPKFPD